MNYLRPKYLKRQLFTIIAVAAFTTTAAHAQVNSESSLDSEVDAQIDQIYPQSGSSAPNRGQVITQNLVLSKSVQKQPVTVIEASPLSNSNADSIRRNRQDEELRTETRIVEKLEISRMEDEKRRASVLFGDKFDTLNNREQTGPVVRQEIIVPSSYVQAQPIIVEQRHEVQQQHVVHPRHEGLTRGDVHQEVRAALEEDKATVSDIESDLFERKFISAQVGMPMYSDAKAIKGNYSVGFGLGTSNDFFEVEGGLVYSSYKIQDAVYATYESFNGVAYADIDMNQYQTYLAAKFLIMGGAIRPSVGGLLSYSYRTYEFSENQYNYTPEGTGSGNTSAIDIGVTAGVDVAISRRFSLGADFKYMFNVSANIGEGTVSGARSPEKLSYYLLGIAAKMSF